MGMFWDSKLFKIRFCRPLLDIVGATFDQTFFLALVLTFLRTMSGVWVHVKVKAEMKMKQKTMK
jgi:hypothetical protein